MNSCRKQDHRTANSYLEEAVWMCEKKKLSTFLLALKVGRSDRDLTTLRRSWTVLSNVSNVWPLRVQHCTLWTHLQNTIWTCQGPIIFLAPRLEKKEHLYRTFCCLATSKPRPIARTLSISPLLMFEAHILLNRPTFSIQVTAASDGYGQLMINWSLQLPIYQFACLVRNQKITCVYQFWP